MSNADFSLVSSALAPCDFESVLSAEDLRYSSQYPQYKGGEQNCICAAQSTTYIWKMTFGKTQQQHVLPENASDEMVPNKTVHSEHL